MFFSLNWSHKSLNSESSNNFFSSSCFHFLYSSLSICLFSSKYSYTSFGCSKRSVDQSRFSKNCFISSSPSGEPCTPLVFSLLGENLPIVDLAIIKEGWDVLAFALFTALIISFSLWPSIDWTSQPKDSNFVFWLVTDTLSTLPSIEILLSSNI